MVFLENVNEKKDIEKEVAIKIIVVNLKEILYIRKSYQKGKGSINIEKNSYQPHEYKE